MKDARGYVERGIASWYGTKFHGRRTSSGEIYDMYGMTAAHKTLPLPTYVRVTNLKNGRSVVVKVNDRGPFHDNRLIDLSYTAAKKLGIVATGTGLVEVRAITPGEPEQPPVRMASRHSPATLGSRLRDMLSSAIHIQEGYSNQRRVFRSTSRRVTATSAGCSGSASAPSPVSKRPTAWRKA